MKKPPGQLVQSVRDHLREIHRRGGWAFPSFFEEAGRQLPEHAEEPQFRFIVLRIWMQADLDQRCFWEHFLVPSLRAEYERIDAQMSWEPKDLLDSGWMSPELLQRTLALWQARTPQLLNVQHAVRMVRSTARLADLGGMA